MGYNFEKKKTNTIQLTNLMDNWTNARTIKWNISCTDKLNRKIEKKELKTSLNIRFPFPRAKDTNAQLHFDS